MMFYRRSDNNSVKGTPFFLGWGRLRVGPSPTRKPTYIELTETELNISFLT